MCANKHNNFYSTSWRNDFRTLQSHVITEETLYRCTVRDKLLFIKSSYMPSSETANFCFDIYVFVQNKDTMC